MSRGPLAPYYEDDSTVIYHGDCRDVLPALALPDHAVVTDPPYGVTSLAWDRWPEGWVGLVTARQLWCFGSMRMWLAHHGEFESTGWRYSQEVVWEKHNGSGFHADRFKRVHDLALHWYRGPWRDLGVEPVMVDEATARRVHRKKRPAHMGNTGDHYYVSEGGGPKLQRSVIYARSCHGHGEHPTQKPTEILRPLIGYTGAQMIVDPFMGSGSTMRVAKEMGRRSIGIEVDERYCEIAARRMGQEVLPL